MNGRIIGTLGGATRNYAAPILEQGTLGHKRLIPNAEVYRPDDADMLTGLDIIRMARDEREAKEREEDAEVSLDAPVDDDAPKQWTPTEVGILVLGVMAGLSFAEIAERTKHSKGSCKAKIKLVRDGIRTMTLAEAGVLGNRAMLRKSRGTP